VVSTTLMSCYVSLWADQKDRATLGCVVSTTLMSCYVCLWADQKDCATLGCVVSTTLMSCYVSLWADQKDRATLCCVVSTTLMPCYVCFIQTSNSNHKVKPLNLLHNIFDVYKASIDMFHPEISYFDHTIRDIRGQRRSYKGCCPLPPRIWQDCKFLCQQDVCTGVSETCTWNHSS